jgi:molybdate transport system substrate-binding protein
MQASACATRTRYCARCVLCWPAFPSASALGSTGSAADRSALFVGFTATMAEREPGSKLVLARVGIGVAVRAGATKPDISSVEAFKRALLAAKSIVYTDPAVGGTSGIHFAKVLDRLGIAQEIKAKSILNAQAAITPSAEIVARGEAELGIQLISEIVSVPGAELVGPLPAELQAMTVLSAGIVINAQEADAARALFKFLTSPAAASVIKAAGMEPGGS